MFFVSVTEDGRIEPIQMLGAYSFLIGGIILAVLILLGELYWKKKVADRAMKLKQQLKMYVHQLFKKTPSHLLHLSKSF